MKSSKYYILWVCVCSFRYPACNAHAPYCYTGQQRFCRMRKNACFWCIFGRWIEICFQNFSITHTFRSRLKGWNLLRQDTKVCFYRGRHEEFTDFFSQWDGVVFCNDVCSVTEVLGHIYMPYKQCLFTDSSKVSLKVVLLHNGNKFPSVPLAHAANMNESYESMKLLLGKSKYDVFRWKSVISSRLWHCYSECNSRTQNTSVSCASGTAGTRRITM